MRTVRSSTTPTRSPPTTSRRSRRPSSRSRWTTSIRRWKKAIELMDMLGDAEIKYAINGLLSLTPDAMPVLGETVEVRNLWSAAAVWIKEGPGIAQLVAEWMTYGYPRIADPHSSDIARFYPHEKHRTPHLRPLRRALQQDLRHRAPPRAVGQPARHAPQPVLRSRRGPRCGVLRRPRVGASPVVRVQRRPPRALPRPVQATTARVGRPLVVTDHQCRTPPPARRTSAWSTSPRSTSSTSRARARVDYLQYMTVNSVNVPVGRSVYTPLLTADGGFRSDLTSCVSPTTTSASSPAPSTVAVTSTGSRGTCPPTGR